MARHRIVIIRCPDCGERRAPLRGIVIRHCVDDDRWTYRGRCPACGLLFAGRTTRVAAESALDSGARLEEWRLPLELDERRRPTHRSSRSQTSSRCGSR